MKGGVPIRRTWTADCARLIGATSVPVLLLVAILTRTGVVPVEAHLAAVALGFGLALLALAFGLYALGDIWNSGAEGADAAIVGIAYASPALAVLALVSAAAVVYPRIADSSTDTVDPLPLAYAGSESSNGQPSGHDPALVAHRYPHPVDAIYDAARELIEQRGWILLFEAPPQIVSEVRADETGEEVEGEVATEERLIAPPSDGLLQALARTPIFGFPDDVAVRVRETPAGTQVDMRSASRVGTHDLGANARRINAFLSDLDAMVQLLPGAPLPAPAEPEAPVEGEAEAPSQ